MAVVLLLSRPDAGRQGVVQICDDAATTDGGNGGRVPPSSASDALATHQSVSDRDSGPGEAVAVIHAGCTGTSSEGMSSKENYLSSVAAVSSSLGSSSESFARLSDGACASGAVEEGIHCVEGSNGVVRQPKALNTKMSVMCVNAEGGLLKNDEAKLGVAPQPPKKPKQRLGGRLSRLNRMSQSICKGSKRFLLQQIKERKQLLE